MSASSLHAFVPGHCLSDAARGLSQQMVFWGHDVRHPDGNSLVRFGMSRTPSPGLPGTSCYAMPWENGSIELHGAVASWTPGDHSVNGFIFSRDRARIELWTGDKAPIPGWQKGTFGNPEERWASFQPFLRWLLDYETWVHQTHGREWRSGCWRAIKRLPKGKPWLPPPLARDWWQLACDGKAPRAKQLIRNGSA